MKKTVSPGKQFFILTAFVDRGPIPLRAKVLRKRNAMDRSAMEHIESCWKPYKTN